MSIVVQQTTAASSGGTCTVQDIIDACQRDMQNVVGANHVNLIDYVNRIHLYMLRRSRWEFLLSIRQLFITQEGQTDYWIGATGTNTAGTVDTKLNLTDIGFIKRDSVKDRSNFKDLGRVKESPLANTWFFQDNAARQGRPAQWRHDVDTTNVINIYPAPDNQNGYTPVPQTPNLTFAAGGALAARSYFVKTTFVDSKGGESQGSIPLLKAAFIPVNNLVTVQSPQVGISQSATGILYNKYNVYATSGASGTETLQNASPIAIGTNFTEPTTGLTTTGATAPTSSTLAPLAGYVIEFRYYKARQQLTLVTDALQIPCDYRDILVAGVNWLTLKYLGQADVAQEWRGAFVEGISHMVTDNKQQLFPAGGDFIRPDPSSQSNAGFLDTTFYGFVVN